MGLVDKDGLRQSPLISSRSLAETDFTDLQDTDGLRKFLLSCDLQDTYLGR